VSSLILHTSEDGASRIQLRADGQTVWLTQAEMAELFAATKQNISLHLKNIFEDKELDVDSVVKESLTTAADGKDYRTRLYNLDAIRVCQTNCVTAVTHSAASGTRSSPNIT